VSFVNEIYSHLLDTAVSLLALMVIYIIVAWIVLRKIEGKKNKHRVKVRLFYVFFAFFAIMMARIWVEGFTHLLAVLGLVSAGLVVTNKETIMNFVGFIVINWRGLFSEDDLIEIQGYKGYVKSFGFLYFSLYEVSELCFGQLTGRIIRLPNGLITTNPLVNFSDTAHLIEQSFSLDVSLFVVNDEVVSSFREGVNDIISSHYSEHKKYSVDRLLKNNKSLKPFLTLTPKVDFAVSNNDLTKSELVLRYYCFLEDVDKIKLEVFSLFGRVFKGL